MVYYLYRYLMLFVAKVAYQGGIFNTKLKSRNQGLRHQKIPTFKSSIWIHCASLGEFEQGKVLIDALRKRYPDRNMVLTFFSSSGYEKRKDYNMVDTVLYLPYDTPVKMKTFIDKINPELVVFIKYEFWFTLLDILHKKEVPFIFVSSVFRYEQYLFQPGFESLRNRILNAHHIFVQNEISRKVLDQYDHPAVTQVGDTRIDRVLELKQEDFIWSELLEWVHDSMCVVAGSTWPAGEKMISNCIAKMKNVKWIIAPHELGNVHLETLRIILGDDVVFLSDLEGMDSVIPKDKKVFVIDKIGILSFLYRYGDIAYIGGGFGAGIHNTLEPAVYGLPLMFGPKFKKFQEAVDFYELGVAHVVHNPEELVAGIDYFSDLAIRQSVKRKLEDYFNDHSGASDKIIKKIEKILSTT